MGHALELAELAPDEIGISVEFAARLMKSVKQQANIELVSPWELDGFPIYGTRFPIGKGKGIDEMTLRVLPGKGRYLACNPWVLGKQFLGDRDGDLLFALLRIDKWWRGEVENRPRLQISSEIDRVQSSLSLSSVLDPKFIGKGKPVHLSTKADRLAWIESADIRGHVAVYTVAIHWWLARTFILNGMETTAAYRKAADCFCPFVEGCMDARKPGETFGAGSFDAYQFMEALMRGASETRDIDFHGLRQLGIPEEALETLKLGWLMSGRNLRRFCQSSPVYSSLVIRQNDLQNSVRDLLVDLQREGVQPADVYATIIQDLQGDEIMSVELSARVIGNQRSAESTCGNQWISRR
jgi:hypothetical protein